MKKIKKDILLLKAKVCDFLLNQSSEYDVKETISQLKDFGLTYDELLKLNFNIQDVDRVFMEEKD